MMRRHRQLWLITRWSKRNRQAAWMAAEDAAQAHQAAEYQIARARMLAFTEPTIMLPVVPVAKAAPLLTRGQSARAAAHPIQERPQGYQQRRK